MCFQKAFMSLMGFSQMVVSSETEEGIPSLHYIYTSK